MKQITQFGTFRRFDDPRCPDRSSCPRDPAGDARAAEADRRRHRPPRAGSRYRPRLACRDADEAVRSAEPCPRARPDADLSARQGQSGCGRNRAGRRSPPDPLHLSERHPRHGLSRLEHPKAEDERFLYLPSLGTGPPHRRLGGAGELRRQRLHLRGHRRPRVRRIHLRDRRRERVVDVLLPAVRLVLPGGSNRAERTRAQISPASYPPSSRTASSSLAPRSSTAATKSRRSTPSAASSRSKASGPRWMRR